MSRWSGKSSSREHRLSSRPPQPFALPPEAEIGHLPIFEILQNDLISYKTKDMFLSSLSRFGRSAMLSEEKQAARRGVGRGGQATGTLPSDVQQRSGPGSDPIVLRAASLEPRPSTQRAL